MNILKNALKIQQLAADPAKEAERAELAAKLDESAVSHEMTEILRTGRDFRSKRIRAQIRKAK